MSVRALTSTPINSANLARNRISVGIVACTVASSHSASNGYPIHSRQVRMFWGRGWKSLFYNPHACHARVNRVEMLHDMGRNYRAHYIPYNRMAGRKHGNYQLWQKWGNASRQSHRWSRSDRITNFNDENGRKFWAQDLDKLAKKIEADPYNFLFGRSNQYLQLPRRWSAFCRSFLDSQVTPEQIHKPTSGGFRSKRNEKPDEETSFVKKRDESNVTNSHNTFSRNGDLHYDPVSGRMRPTKDWAKSSKDIDSKGNGLSETSGSSTIEPQRTAHPISPFQIADSQVRGNDVLYMAGPTKDAPVVRQQQSKPASHTMEQQEIAQNTRVGQKSKVQEKLEYDLNEIKEDDVDLLRASDIRASFFSGQTKQEIAEKKKIVREALERDYLSYSGPQMDVDSKILQDLRLKRDISAINTVIGEGKAANEAKKITGVSEEPKAALNSSLYSEPEVMFEQTPIGARQKPGQKNFVHYKTISSNNPLGEIPLTVTDDTLGYAPGGAFESARQSVHDIRALTQDILKACERLESSTIPSDTFRILAYDSVSSQVVIAETTSSIHAEQTSHPAEVLLHINNPAKFLPHFAKMKADGYEIVSGGGDILIFRKTIYNTRDGMTDANIEFSTEFLSAADRNTPSSIGRGAGSSPSTQKQASSQARMVQRQETIYTGGPPNWSPYPVTSSELDVGTQATSSRTSTKDESQRKPPRSARIGKGIRRIILSGVATAGTVYAIGVVCEYFLTGGQDGLGPEGFTEFEAERRRRD